MSAQGLSRSAPNPSAPLSLASRSAHFGQFSFRRLRLQLNKMLHPTLALVLAATATASNESGLKFLEENKNKPGVITLPSGLQYKVLRAGDGDAHPKAGTSCECHYEGRTAQSYPDGETFDSSYARGSPTSFAPNQVTISSGSLHVYGSYTLCAVGLPALSFERHR